MSLGPRPWGRALRACRAEGRSSGRSAFEAWAPGIWLETRHPPSPRHRKNLGHFRSESTIHLWHLSSARELFKPRENSKTRAVQQQPCALWWDPIPQTLTRASKQHDPRLKHPPIRPASCADVPFSIGQASLLSLASYSADHVDTSVLCVLRAFSIACCAGRAAPSSFRRPIQISLKAKPGNMTGRDAHPSLHLQRLRFARHGLRFG